MLIHCSYTLTVWKELEAQTGLINAWGRESAKVYFRLWCENLQAKPYKALPLINAWGIWLVRNSSLFKDKFIYIQICAAQSISIL
jgi:hypothetical protein